LGEEKRETAFAGQWQCRGRMGGEEEEERRRDHE